MKNEDFNCLQEFSFEDILYSNLAPILAYYSENYHTMLPDAIWMKAVKLKTMMAMEVESTDDIVLTVTRRTTQMKRDDRFLVLFTLLYMLYVPLPGQDNDTMLAIMAGIAREVYHHPWFEEAMLKMGAKRKEDDGCMAAEPLIGGNIDEVTMTDVAIALWDNCDDVTKRGLKLAFFEVNRASDNKFDNTLDVISAIQNGECTIEDLKRDRKKARMDVVVEDKGTTFKLKLTDKEAKKLLDRLMEVKGDDGKYMFYKPCQWIAIYRIFVDVLEWTTEYRSFSKRSNHLGELRIPCTENAVKRIDGVFNLPFVEWDEAKYKGKGKVFQRQYCIGAWLMKELRAIKKKQETAKVTAKLTTK